MTDKSFPWKSVGTHSQKLHFKLAAAVVGDPMENRWKLAKFSDGSLSVGNSVGDTPISSSVYTLTHT